MAADFDTLANAALARKRLQTNSQSLYVYLVQPGLKKAGRYDGTASGILTKATVVAINRACVEVKTQADCDAGVMTALR